MLSDSSQRDQATDPRGSFIVQAPAGSGKTEILTQRYLRLLSIVTDPEQIIALTFTRKAANEMRERILLALQQVAQGNKATSEHQQKTFQYAKEALDRDNALKWQLLQQPNRLRIMTIDSLCQTLTQAIPLHEKSMSYEQITETPQKHYRAAAQTCLDHALAHESYHTALKTILLHFDNQQDKLLDLFCNLLATREQWLELIYQAKAQNKLGHEQALAWIEQHEVARFRQTLPLPFAQELIELTHNLESIKAQANQTTSLTYLQSLDDLNGSFIVALANLLLTSQNTLRKAFDHHVGLKRGVCSDQNYEILKEKSKNLLSQLAEMPEFVEALLRVRNLPAPQYNEQQWEVLQALLTLLPLLVAHLNLLFTQHQEVDFIAVAQQALQALGDEQSPTDLTLYLDNQIHHILIDEFQDTSILQFQLLKQLICGWQPQEGRTLFVVGDPMQSIYRFRSAEVGLFLRAKLYGIGPIQLTPLELSCNFRSASCLVEWVNQQFKTIFPKHDDIESGAISYHFSSPVRPSSTNNFIKALQYTDKEEEAKAIVECVKQEMQINPEDTIAILVRSRNHLRVIVQYLREQQIPFQGVEIDLLSNLPHLRDIWSLTQALLRPGNRLAWLAFLRSPWCGLTLADLHTLANFSKKQSIYFALSQLPEISGLTEEGRERAQFVYNILNQALAQRHQLPLVDWILQTLHYFPVKQLLDVTQQADLEQYWSLLEKFEQNGQIDNLKLFKDEFNQLYSKRVIPSRLQIMTIHKSKGLEFDSVILPGLGSKSSKSEVSLLRWLKLPLAERELVLLSPIKAAADDLCPLYDYLGKLDAEKSYYERQRLLYVAVTRAKKRLYLFDNQAKTSAGTFRGLLSHQEFIEVGDTSNELIAESAEIKLPTLYRLPLDFYQNCSIPFEPGASVSLAIHDSNSRLLGIVAHELLQWICDYHPLTFNNIPWDLARHRLRSMGFETEKLVAAEEELRGQFSELFQNPIGQWLVKKHQDERNEYALLVNEDGEMATRIIDRTFHDQGIQWIIDFKTGKDNLEKQTQHRQQVNAYAHLLAEYHTNSIHCGLYYLATGQWVHWEHS